MRAVRGVSVGLGLLLFTGGCASSDLQAGATPLHLQDPAAVLNRVTWGVDDAVLRRANAAGMDAYIAGQLRPGPAPLPESVEALIAEMTISQQPLQQLVQDMEVRRKAAALTEDPEQKLMAQQAYQRELGQLARQAAERSLFRALHSPQQLQEQMTWFWMNHFSVHQGKGNLRAMIGDYEENAIRPHALGRFRDLLGAVVRHPAMLRYLDNERNGDGRINENYARELMELHTLGVGGGYSQQDVQELARIFTGLGINQGPTEPKVKKELTGQYVREGLMEFNPNRHDYGDKQLLGTPVKGRGLEEVDEAVTMLARHPATARYISRKLAIHYVQDEPPARLVQRMSRVFLESDGDIAATLREMLCSPEFGRSLGDKFKDPMHYVLSAVRLAYNGETVSNVGPILSWLNRLGQPLYGRQTPDGYPMVQSAWASAGQMTTRFEFARAMSAGSAGFFATGKGMPAQKPPPVQLTRAANEKALTGALSPTTRQVLDQATSPRELGTLLLASPEMMNR